MVFNWGSKKEKLIGVEQVRRLVAWCGLVGVLVAEATAPGIIQNIAATIGVIGFAMAALIMLFKGSEKVSENQLNKNIIYKTKTWRLTLVFLGLLGVLLVQSWFITGTAIGGGDISPPFGTAWIGRIFSVYDWSGGNLGGINSQQVQLPWAIVSWLVHTGGGSGALAQRIWLSLLVSMIWVGMGALIRSLRMSPLAGIVAAAVYFLNPYTISVVGVSGVFLAAMALVVILPAALISYGLKNFEKWKLILLFGISAPFLGFAYSNPPLAGMIAVLLGITPFIASIRFGKEVRNKSLWGLFLGSAVLIAFSSYWIIPSLLALHGVATSTLSKVVAWAWTEGRSTLANAFWMNTTWGWNFPTYYPYAKDFSRFPLNLVRSALPALVFSGLVMRQKAKNKEFFKLTKLYGVLVLLSLVLIFISTGTRSPGSILFNILYQLPYGWLLREPGRFIMLVALAYALMAGILVEVVGHGSFVSKVKSKFYFPSQYIFSFMSLLLSLIISFPIWMGIIIPGPRQGFPSSHIKEPIYWKTFSNYLNGPSSPKGPLLVLPQDTFYQMPYTWYYGNDAFIVNILKRKVIIPNGQGYYNVSSNLLKDVKLESLSLLNHQWNEANSIMTAMGIPLVMVRGDIQVGRNKSITSPLALNASLKLDPLMRLVKKIGSLSIYKQKIIAKVQDKFATINTTSPNLSFLSKLASGVTLFSHTPVAGHISIFQLPELAKWEKRKNNIFYSIRLPTGWLYHPVIFGSSSSTNSVAVHPNQTRKLQTNIKAGLSLLKVRLQRSLITNGNFTHGSWGKLGNCGFSLANNRTSSIKGYVALSSGPFGNRSLTLQSSYGSACEARLLSWHQGSFLLNFWSRTKQGSPSRICLWEEPAGKCIGKNTILSSSSQWHHYSVLANPTSGTKSISLFLYADTFFKGQTSKEQYSNISIRKLPFGGKVAIFGKPISPIVPTSSMVTREGFSTRWVEPKFLSHVLVDGLRNGWLVDRSNIIIKKPTYEPAQQEARFELFLSAFSFVAFLIVLVLEKKYSIKH